MLLFLNIRNWKVHRPLLVWR